MPNPGNRLLALIGAGLALALLLSAAPVSAESRTYALDEDPIRLGIKASEAGRIADARGEFLRAIADDYQVHRAKFGLAELAVQEGRFADAEPLYREAVSLRRETRGGYPQANAGLGLLLLHLGRELEAEREFEDALESDKRLWPAHYGMARILMQRGRRQEARLHLDRGDGLKGIAEGEDLYHHAMALYALSGGDLDGAERDALLAFHLNPANPDYGELVGRIYEQRNAPTMAIDAYEKALAAPGRTSTAPMLQHLGLLCEKVGRFNDARTHYLRSLAADSIYAPVLKNLAQLYRRADQHEQAARAYLRYVMLEPEDGEALLDLADSCYEIGRYAQGASAARAALALAPGEEPAEFAFARCGIHSRDDGVRAEAAESMAALPDSLPWRAGDLVALASHIAKSGRLAAARTQLERALRISPDEPDALFELGVISLKQGRPAEAIDFLSRAADLNPESPAYLINLGIAHFQAGNYLAAVPDFQRALALNPDLSAGRLLLAQAYAVSDSLAAAEKQYRRVLDAEPANAKALRGLAFCHVRGARYAEAVAAYRGATAADPLNAEGWAGLGNAHLGLEEFAKARAAYLKARSLDPNSVTVTKGLELLEQAERERANGG